MRLVIFGASGRTGRLLVDRALGACHQVVAVTRRPESITSRGGIGIVAADITDRESVDSAIAGTGAVLSAVATPCSRKPIRMFSLGASNVVAAMRQHGVKRLIVVSSAMVDPAWQPSGAFFFNKIVDPLILRKLGRTLYEDLVQMESVVRASELDWTIVRPSGLFN